MYSIKAILTDAEPTLSVKVRRRPPAMAQVLAKGGNAALAD